MKNIFPCPLPVTLLCHEISLSIASLYHNILLPTCMSKLRRWWRTGKAGMLQSTGLQRIGHNLATEQQQPACHKKILSWGKEKIMLRRDPSDRERWCLERGSRWFPQVLKEVGIQATLPASWEICMQVRKQRLELDMEQQTGSKLGKEDVKSVFYHPAYLTYMQRTSWEMLGWMKHKLESRLLGEI